MPQKDSSKSCGCFGSLFGKKPSGSGKGKNTSERSKIIRAASNHLLSSSRKKSGSPKKVQVSSNGVVQKSDDVADKLITTSELQNKIISFRELLNLPPCISALTIIELVKDTVKELHNLYPDVVQCGSVSVSDSGSMPKAINELCESIKSLGKHLTQSDEWMLGSKKDDEANGDLEKYALDLLDDIINVAQARIFNKKDTDDDKQIKEEADSPSSSYDGKSSRRSNFDKERCSSSSTTPTSVLAELPNNKSAKMDPHVVQVNMVSEVDEDNGHSDKDEGKNKDGSGNSDGLVRAHMEISVPPSVLKSIVDAENILIPATTSPSSSSERPSISATIISPPQQLLVSEESQPPPQPGGKLEISPPLPPPPPPPPPPPDLSVGENDITTPEPPPPPPPPSMATSNTTLVSDPPPPPHSPAPPPPPPPPPAKPSMPSSDDSTPPQQAPLPTPSPRSPALSSPPRMTPGPPPPPPAPAASGSNPPPATPALPPLPPSAPGNAMPASLGSCPPSPSPTASRNIPPPPPSKGSGPAPPPPPPSSGGSVPVPLPPGRQGKGGGGAPPPPPAVGGSGKLLRKSVSKLKRSSQMGCLYRQLKAKVEGSNSKATGKSPQKKGSKVGASGGNGKQGLGMADALAEMTKRSSYFQQIEEDVTKYSDAIKEVKVALASFQTSDMNELIKFHKYVESHLEKLTDETQVLARFEDFPSKKLEGLRMAGALYSKLDTIYTDLQNWKIEPPVNDLLDRVENYFNKIKEEIDALDRTKDDELKKFKSQKIHFDFGILIRIKESMVDVSSSCMELALKEKRETSSSKKNEKKETSSSKKNGKKTDSGKILWKAFQFAFRVYSFAGGQDERAENLTKEIAQQIQAETLQ
ncbi:unnamed protein product [Lactuca saligna]|uniref:Uncharacterized protein n=1 Tax=Lactuca saligna TaxID=75948 RepID=A0AA35Y2Z3_LACSI|nr:unnamed protein product [Lactuca saligna]